jgi:hypothetical protein
VCICNKIQQNTLETGETKTNINEYKKIGMYRANYIPSKMTAITI